MSARQPLTNRELLELAPALATNEPHHQTSKKYHFINTLDIVNELRAHSWYPVSVSQSSVRDEDKEGYQQHVVRFVHFSDLLHHADNVVELLLFNSHDRSKCFSIGAGIYRFVCANGLVISDKVFESYTIKHLGDRNNDVANAVANITAIKGELLDKISRLECIQLSNEEKESFALSAIPLRFEPHLEVNPKDLLVPHREADCANDIYTTMNVIQENMIRSGHISGVNKETGRRFTNRGISSIAKDTAINKGLWEIAERILTIKEPATFAVAA